MSVYDAPTFVAVAVLLGIVALIASWLPARRASRVDAVLAPRADESRPPAGDRLGLHDYVCSAPRSAQIP
jgi:hypothetical protein